MRPADKTNVRIETLERLTNSRNGNPRFRVTLSDGSEHLTQSDAAIGYELTNPEFRGQVDLWLSRAGRIQYARPAAFLVLVLSDGSSAEIRHAGKSNSDGMGTRQVYAWSVTVDGAIVAASADDDSDAIRSGVGAPVDLPDAARSFASFVGAFAESSDDGENADLFPPSLRDWADANADELYVLTTEDTNA